MELSEALKGATIKILNRNGVTQTSTPPNSVQVQTPEKDDLLMSYFNIDTKDLTWEKSDKMAKIREFISSNSEDKTDLGAINLLRDIKFRLGAPRAGINPLDHIYNYIKLRQTAKQFEDRAKSMEV